MLKKIAIVATATVFSVTIQAAPAPKVQQVEIVGPSMLPVDVVNTVGVEIVGPSMLPVDVMNTVKIVGPMFLPSEIAETTIGADGEPGTLGEAQVIRKMIVLPIPNESVAMACRVSVKVAGANIAQASWNGDEYKSFSLSLPGLIDVEAQTEIVAELTTFADVGKCSAEIFVLGTLIETH